MERVVVTRPFLGLCTMQVCAVLDVTDEEILKVCNELNPSGTTAGWCTVVRNDEALPGRNPGPCEELPERLHFLVEC